MSCQGYMEYSPYRGSILNQGPELFKGQRRHQVRIINAENDRVLPTCGEEHIQRSCSEIEAQGLIKHLQQRPKSQISIRDIHSFVLPLLGKGQIDVQKERFSEPSVAKNRSYPLALMKAVDESG